MKSRKSAREAIGGRSYEVCVIGGGATGLGCALDARLRGFSTVLLEASDFAGCTSMASTKLVHGGVRYLEQAVRQCQPAQYALVRRALRERIAMLRRAPHLASPIELLLPCRGLFELAYYGIGLKLYDWLAGAASLFPSRLLSRAEALELMPALRGEEMTACVAYSDGQFDDARYAIALAEAFAQQGGELINYMRAVAFEKDASKKDAAGRLIAVEAEDQLTGERLRIRARIFLNCTGPYADQLRHLANPALPPRLRLSKGVHLLLPLEAAPSECALLIPRTEDGRVLFAIPWQGRLLVGTTDEEAALADARVVTPTEIEYLLRHLRRHLKAEYTAEDVQSAFAGVRSLLCSAKRTAEGAELSRLVRDHEIETDAVSGLISVLGGKWTTYRAMAEDAIDCAERILGERRSACSTLSFALPGAEGFWSGYWRQLGDRYDISAATARHLAEKFGTDAPRVLELADCDPALMQPLAAGVAVIGAEVAYAVRREMAQAVEDVLQRRTGLQFFGWRQAAAAAPAVGRLLARELGWSEAETADAVARYLDGIRHQMRSAGVQE